jgi:hypothetical protein
VLRRLSLSATFAVFWSVVVLLAPPATAAGHGDRCDRLDPASLPHTADPAQAWFDNCRRHSGVPRSADAAQAWLAQAGRAGNPQQEDPTPKA